MEKIDIINNFCKIFIINIYAYVTCFKISNYKRNKFRKINKVFISSIITATVYVILMQYINQIFIIPIVYCIFTIIIKILLKQKLNYCLFLVNISFVFTYMIYFISVLIAGILVIIILPKTKYNNTINILIIFNVMLLIYYSLIKIKRLKNGINFLKNTENINKIESTVNIISLIILVVFGLLHVSRNLILNYLLSWVTITTLAGFIYWAQYQITKHYKKNMKDRTIEIQKTEIDEQVKIIEDIKEENLKLATAVHKYNHRLSALEMAMKKAIEQNANTEFANELSVILEETDELSKSFVKESNVIKQKLPLTNIVGIDNMFMYMQKEALENSINFDLKINESIHDLIDNIIPKDKFEILLGDHLKDAIIAVNASNNSYKSILTTLGKVENCYELSIYDTGIEFDIETLLKLGKEQITTHKDTGGSGIGFITTFETLKNTNASLVIEEYNPKTTNYTKSVNIRFDGKCEYRIYSYRAEELKKQNKEKRIIIKTIE